MVLQGLLEINTAILDLRFRGDDEAFFDGLLIVKSQMQCSASRMDTKICFVRSWN